MSTTDTSFDQPESCMDSPEMDSFIHEVLPDLMNEDLLNVARAAGIKAALDIMLTLGGSTIYVPCVEDLQRRLRDERIRREYDCGVRVKDIGRRYGLTERTIYKVLRKRSDRE